MNLDYLNKMKCFEQSKIYGKYLAPQKAVLVYRKLFKKHNITTEKQWEKFAKSNKKLLDELKIPTNPLELYTLENAKKVKCMTK